jgi:hypothetical protein
MSAEQRNKAENTVEIRRPSRTLFGGFESIQVPRVRQPFMAKEPLCGNQSTNISLVIAVFHFPSCFVVLPYYFWFSRRSDIANKY